MMAGCEQLLFGPKEKISIWHGVDGEEKEELEGSNFSLHLQFKDDLNLKLK
jgi:hypothetical protein